jgi:hypothetical protein
MRPDTIGDSHKVIPARDVFGDNSNALGDRITCDAEDSELMPIRDVIASFH